MASGEKGGFQIELAGLDFRQIENVVDDREQARPGPCDDFGVASMTRRKVSRRQHLGHHHHAIHRRPDFVAHGSEEV